MYDSEGDICSYSSFFERENHFPQLPSICYVTSAVMEVGTYEEAQGYNST